MPQPGQRRHHFLPVAYLSGFTTTGTKKGFLHVTARDGKRWEAKPSAIGFARGLYRLDAVAGAGAEDLEAVFARSEGELSPVLRQIDEERRLPKVGSHEYDVVVSFIATLAVRTPAARRRLERIQAEMGRRWARAMVETPEKWQQLLAMARAEGIDLGPEAEDYETMRRAIEESHVVPFVPHDALQAGMMQAQEVIFETMAERRWEIVVAAAGGPLFVTSDDPVVLTSVPRRRRGFGDPLSTVTVPLTRNVAVVGIFSGAPPRRGALQDGPPGVNGRTAMAAARYVLSPAPAIAWLTPRGEMAGRDDLIAFFAEQA